MHFELTEDQTMIRDTARSFVQKESPVERMRKLRDTDLGYDAAVWQKMGELGWLGLPFSDADGGFGGDMIDVALVLEQLGSTLVPEPYTASVVLGGMAVAKTAQGSLRSELLGPMIEGRTSLALAWSEEAARYDATRVATTAERTDGGHALRGTKTWVLNGHAAEQLVVSAKTKAGVSLFAVPRAASGVHVESVKTMDGGRAARVRLDGAVGQLLGDDGAGAGVLDEVLDMGAAAACAEGLGIANAVLWMTVEYLRTRKQFGVPIGVFQALQHRAVDMFVAVELMKGTSILANARVASDDPELRRSAVSAAKATLSTSGFMVVAQAIQLHGGIGVTDEHDVSLYFKRMRVLNALFGDEEHHVQRYMSSPRFTEALG